MHQLSPYHEIAYFRGDDNNGEDMGDLAVCGEDNIHPR